MTLDLVLDQIIKNKKENKEQKPHLVHISAGGYRCASEIAEKLGVTRRLVIDLAVKALMEKLDKK